MKARFYLFFLMFCFVATKSYSQTWNSPEVQFTYTATDSMGDSMFIWKLQYDSVGNAKLTSSKSNDMGNSVSAFHMPISDAKMQPVEGKCDMFSFAFSGEGKGYTYYVFDMDSPEKSYSICHGQKELVIACMCVLGDGCCVPQVQPAGHGLNVTCNVENNCLKCGKPVGYYIDSKTKKKTGVAWNGPTLVIKAKKMNYNSN